MNISTAVNAVNKTRIRSDWIDKTRTGSDRINKAGSDPKRSDRHKFPPNYSRETSDRKKKADVRCVPLGCVFPFCQYYLGKKFCYSLTLLTISFPRGKDQEGRGDTNRKNALLVKTNAHFQGPRTVAK